MNTLLARTAIAPALAAVLLAGCATPAPRPMGAVLPMEGGRYQSSVKGPSEPQALKTFVHDAEATCYKGDDGPRMPWQGKAAPAKYVVVSQMTKNKDGKKIESSDNKMLDAGIAAGMRYTGLESKDSVEVTTVFKCQ